MVAGSLMMATAACQPGESGDLTPIAGQTAGPDSAYGDKSVMLASGTLKAAVSGSWRTSRSLNSVDTVIVYRNDGRETVDVALSKVSSLRGRDEGTATEGLDMTKVDLTGPATEPDRSVKLLDVYGGGTETVLHIRPGETRTVTVIMSLSSDIAPIDEDQTISVSVPMGPGSAVARFATTSSWF